MDRGEYGLELALTDNAIRANQSALITALVAAGDVVVKSRMGGREIKGIREASIELRRLCPDSPYVVAYKTVVEQSGEIDVLKAYLISEHTTAAGNRVFDLLHAKKIDRKFDVENLGYSGRIRPLVGLPEYNHPVIDNAAALNVCEELRANDWRKPLKRFGVDFSQNAEAVLVDPSSNPEVVTFFYRTKDSQGPDNGVMVALTFNERHGNNNVFVCTRERMAADISNAQRACGRFPSDVSALLEPIPVRTYVEKGQRLTKHRS